MVRFNRNWLNYWSIKPIQKLFADIVFTRTSVQRTRHQTGVARKIRELD